MPAKGTLALLAGAALLLTLSDAALAPAPAWAAPRSRTVPPPAFLRTARVSRIGAWPAKAPVVATIVLKPRHPAALAAAAAAASVGGSGHPLDAAQIQKRFGPTPATVRTLSAALRRHGFAVARRGWTLTVKGSAQAWSSMLSTRLGRYRWDGYVFRARSAAMLEPAWLASAITGITGLTDFVPPPAPPLAAGRVGRPVLAAPVPAAAGASAPVTASSGGFTVTMAIPGGTSKETGLPMHAVFETTLDGQPDTTGGISWKQGVEASDVNWLYGALDGLPGGYNVMRLESSGALTTSVNVTVYAALQSDGYPVPGTPSVTFALPTVTWTGPKSVQALSAAQVDGLYGASALAAQSAGTASVGLVEAEPESSAMAAALADFTLQNHLAPATVSVVNVTTGSPPSGGWGQEENMDLQVAEAAAPGSHLTVYSDPTFDLGALLSLVESDPTVPVLSMSFGAVGGYSSLVPLIESLNAEGVTVVASAGDFGSMGTASSGSPPNIMAPAVDEPAALPDVTGVGGTAVAVASGTSAAAATVAWGGVYLSALAPDAQAAMLNDRVATGGGFTATQPVPSWQTPFVAASSGRGVPDVAFLANPNVSGLEIVGRSAGLEIAGGTSQGAPLLAGFLADIAAAHGAGLGNINPLLYGLAAADPGAFTQAPSGDNGAYTITASDGAAGTWNPLTGLGSPNMQAVLNAVAHGLPPAVSLALPSGAAVGTPVTIGAASQRVADATYQFWVEEPTDGVWFASGPYSSVPSFSFDPAVPGRYPVVVYARPSGSAAAPIQAEGFVTVTSSTPMVSALTVTSPVQGAVQPAGSSVQFTATAVDPLGTALYQFWVRGPSGVWRIAQNYSTVPTFTLQNLAPGSYAVSVYALDKSQVAAQAWTDAYNFATVVNVASRVTLAAPPSAVAGATVTAVAASSGLTDPVYQFWVEDPDGSWLQSGPYSATATYQFTPSVTGTYHVVVYAKDPIALNNAHFAVTSETTVSVVG
jgi:subtilase family serine protease